MIKMAVRGQPQARNDKTPQIATVAYSNIACTRPQVLHAAAIEAALPAHN